MKALRKLKGASAEANPMVKSGVKWKKARERAGLSQGMVAKALGYRHGQFISNIESGRSRFPLEKLATVRKLYRMSLREILDVVMEEQEQLLHKNLRPRK